MPTAECDVESGTFTSGEIVDAMWTVLIVVNDRVGISKEFELASVGTTTLRTQLLVNSFRRRIATIWNPAHENIGNENS